MLRAQTNSLYDEQGRLYRTQVFDVNPSTGAVSSSALTTDVWYDHAGQVLKTASPGGLVTKQENQILNPAPFFKLPEPA